MKEIGIYIHIPFCIQKCSYCDFTSFDNKEKEVEKYIEVLKKEIIMAQVCDFAVVKTIYIGGGTPSYIDSKHIKEILDCIREKYQIDKSAEITIEINPRYSKQKKVRRI